MNISDRFSKLISNSRAQKVGSVVGVVAAIWFGAAFGAMLLTGSYPVLDPFVKWTFRLYLYCLSAFAAAITIVGPGIYVAGELFELVEEPKCSRAERRLTAIWAGLAGLLLTAVLGVATWLIAFGSLADIKLWFVGVCWLFLLIPWLLVGCVGRRILRRIQHHPEESPDRPSSA